MHCLDTESGKIQEELQFYKEYSKNLENLYDSLRSFQHDFNNIIQNIDGYILNNDFDGFKTYYRELSSECKEIKNLAELSPTKINNPAVYSLLSSKYSEAVSNKIRVNLETSIDFSNLNFSIFDFTRILGILLDNAIESCKCCAEKVINIVFHTNKNFRTHYIIIENAYCNFDIDLNKLFEKDYSSKDNNHGIGLWKVQNILNKYDNAFLTPSKDYKLFKQELQILF